MYNSQRHCCDLAARTRFEPLSGNAEENHSKPHSPRTNMSNVITVQTSKDEIVSNACERIDDQSAKISELQQQLKITFWGLGIAIVWGILF